jgi:hypothetical protein
MPDKVMGVAGGLAGWRRGTMRNIDDGEQQKQSVSGRPAEARERLAGSLRRAFPLPDSGEFKDLLDALGSPGSRHS